MPIHLCEKWDNIGYTLYLLGQTGKIKKYWLLMKMVQMGKHLPIQLSGIATSQIALFNKVGPVTNILIVMVLDLYLICYHIEHMRKNTKKIVCR